MTGFGDLSAAIVERLPGSARVTTFLTRRQTRLQPAPGPTPAPPGDDVLRTKPGSGSVELILSQAGASRRNFLVRTAVDVPACLVFTIFLSFIPAAVVFPVVYANGQTSTGGPPTAVLALAAAALLCFIAMLVLGMPRVLRIRFSAGAGPMKLRVVRWWPTPRMRVSALSSITIVEHRYRRPGEFPAGDARRETISSLPYRVDVVLHRTDGGSRTVRGEGHPGWRPDPRNLYGPLGELLAPAGVTIERRCTWTNRPLVRRPRGYFSPGSGGANLGGC